MEETKSAKIKYPTHKRIASLNVHQAVLPVVITNNKPDTFKISNRRYTGSKAQLVNWIMQQINANCEGKTFLDLFAGTGVVASAASGHFDKVFVNDFLQSNFAAYKAFFQQGDFDDAKLRLIAQGYSEIDARSINSNYFSESFGDKFFSHESAIIIGEIRERIEAIRDRLTEKEYWILITSLMYSADKIANTVGHYDAYFKKENNRMPFEFKLINASSDTKFSVFNEDANQLAKKLKADVVYLDPPYNSRQYSRFYHVLENLVAWKKPELFGVARKPKPEKISDYSKVRAKHALQDVINNLECKYIVVSYNNTYSPKSSSSKNKIQLAEIQSILEAKGKTTHSSRSHKHFNSGNTKFDDHKEFLFICKVYDK